jgi:lysophospholipase
MPEHYQITSEDDLPSNYKNVIQPFWENNVEQGRFSGKDDIEIAYAFAVHPKPIGSIVISSGRIESLIKYKELVFDLYQNRYSVFIHDHRGQGLSARMLSNSHLGYVSDFNDYVIDFKQFIDEVVVKHSQHKPHLLCHSMGGAIGVLLLLKYPKLFIKVVFSAPMFGIRPALPGWFSSLLLNIHASFNKQVAYFFGQKGYENISFAVNDLTHSEIRYQIFRQEYQDNPQVQLGGVSADWLKAAIQAMDEIEQKVKEMPIPALVIQAGSDRVVDNKRQSRVAEKMPNVQFVLIDGAKHELLLEKDRYRKACLTAALDFLSNSNKI